MLFDKSYPLCIEDYYVQSGELFYLKSSSNTWGSTTSNKLVEFIYPNYYYDSVNNICSPSSATVLGLSTNDFNFLMALSGIIFSSIIFLVIAIFLTGL